MKSDIVFKSDWEFLLFRLNSLLRKSPLWLGLTFTSYLCHKWLGYVPLIFSRNHSHALSSFLTYDRVLTRVKRWAQYCGAVTVYNCYVPELSFLCNIVYIVLCFLLFFSFGHCIFCPSLVSSHFSCYNLGDIDSEMKQWLFSCEGQPSPKSVQ